MMMLSPLDTGKVYQADIEYGRIINEFSVNKDGVEIPMDEITHETRSAQLDGRSTFLGLGKNRLWKWDTRDSRGIVENVPDSAYSMPLPASACLFSVHLSLRYVMPITGGVAWWSFLQFAWC